MTTNPGTSRAVERARARFARVGFAEWPGVSIADVKQDRAVVVLPHRPEHLNARGVLQGGASASLLAMAGTLAAWTGVDLDADLELSCVDLSVQYLTAAADEDVVAEARVLRRGRGLVVLDVALRPRDDRPICQGLLSYQTSDYAKRQPRVWAQPSLLPVLTTLTPPSGHRLFTGSSASLPCTRAQGVCVCTCRVRPCNSTSAASCMRVPSPRSSTSRRSPPRGRWCRAETGRAARPSACR